jgi:hypothetical protein
MDTSNIINSDGMPALEGTVYAKHLKVEPPRRSWGQWVYWPLDTMPGTLIYLAISVWTFWTFSLFLKALSFALDFAQEMVAYLAIQPSVAVPRDTFVKACTKLARSPCHLEREHVPIGMVSGTNYPVLLHLPLLFKGVHLVGPPGYGKSWFIFMMTYFLLRNNCTVVYMNAKGDDETDCVPRGMAEELGLPVYKFSSVTGRWSNVFNPLMQDIGLSLAELNDILMNADAMTAAGKPADEYFHFKQALVKKRSAKRSRARSFREQLRFLQQRHPWKALGISERDFQHGSGAISRIDPLARITALNAEPGENAINVKDIGERPALYMFDIPMGTGAENTSTVCRHLTTELYTDKRLRGPSPCPIIIILDECLNALNPQMLNILRTARDLRLGLWFAHQSSSDLKPDVLPVVQACSSVQMTFAARDSKTRKWLAESHGEEEATSTSRTTNSRGDSVTVRPEMIPRVGDKEINYVNTHQGSFVLNAGPSGFTQFRHAMIVDGLPHFLTREKVEAYISKYKNRRGPGMVLNVDDPSIDLAVNEPGIEDECEPECEPEPETPRPANRREQDQAEKKAEIMAWFHAAANDL